MEKLNSLQKTSDLLLNLSENVDINIFPAQLKQTNLVKIKKNLFQKNKTSTLKINDCLFNSIDAHQSFEFKQILNKFQVFQNKFNLGLGLNVKFVDPQTFALAQVSFNRKPLTINFLVNNQSKDVIKVINYINEILFKMPFTEFQTKMSINIIIINFFENISGIKLNIPNDISRNFNIIMTTYSEINKIMNINFSELPYYFFTNKFMKIIKYGKLDFSNVQQHIDNITNFLSKSKLNMINEQIGLSEMTIVDENKAISSEIYSNFKKFIGELSKQFHSRKNFYPFNCTYNIKINYEKLIVFNSPCDYKIYYSKPIIFDNSYTFIGSSLHKLLMSNYAKENLTIRRLKLDNKKILTESVSKYFSILNEFGLKTTLEIRKRTNYNFENFSKQYYIKNSIGKLNNNDIMRTYNIQSIFQKLKDLKLSTKNHFNNENFSLIKNVRLKFHYKMYKSKLFKNLKIECKNNFNNTVTYQIDPGTNYLIFIVKASDLHLVEKIVALLVPLKRLCLKENFKVELSVFVVLEEVTQITIDKIEEKIGVFMKDVNFYYIEYINSTKRIFDFVYEYPNRKNFLFIDSEGRFNNFCLKSTIYMIMDKLFNLINKKIKIDKQSYYKLKKIVKHAIPDYDYSNLKYKPTLNLSFEKKTVFNDKMNIVDTQYYIKGDLKINDVDFPSLTSLLNQIKDATNFNNDFIGLKRVFQTFTIPLNKINNCHYCQKDCGNFNVYFCGYCTFFICEKCGNEIGLILHQKEKEKIAKEKEENSKAQKKGLLSQMFNLVIEKGVDKHFQKYKNCVYHNLIVIVNVEKVLKVGSNLTYNFNKLGYNIFAEYLDRPEIKNDYSCSLCSKSLHDTRYCCMNCKAFDYYYDSGGDSNGFLDICEKCFKSINDYEKTNSSDFNIQRVFIEHLRDNENHIHSEHIYAKYPYNSGNYFIN